MKTRRRWDRASGAVLAITGVFLLVFTVVGLAPAVSDLGSTQGHLADEAVLNLAIFGPMLAVVVLSTLGCAWLLWRGWRGARALALVWIVGAGLFAAQDLAGGGDTCLSRVIAMAAIAVAVLLVGDGSPSPQRPQCRSDGPRQVRPSILELDRSDHRLGTPRAPRSPWRMGRPPMTGGRSPLAIVTCRAHGGRCGGLRLAIMTQPAKASTEPR
jgi:hypothetical protein